MALSSNSKKNNFKNFYLTSIITLLFILIEPVHAYAGPGVAIGALIVFITVILTFFASFFLTIFRYLSKLFHYLYRLLFKNITKKRKIKKVKK
tara:strand:- start:12 stop:290 length:279 start_codon:yes stop_codon:yes gene_type:complete